MKKIRVAIIGVGNCAKSLIEGVEHYIANPDDSSGLAFKNIGGYKASDIEFVLAYDVDSRKVGKYLCYAKDAGTNNAMDLIEYDDTVDEYGSTGEFLVKMGRISDGVAPHMCTTNEKDKTRFCINPHLPQITKELFIADLFAEEVDVVLNYLPVGSEEATRFYLDACIEAKVPFVNCIPVFIVSSPEYHTKLVEAGIPAIGDDMRSQLGASVMSQALQELFFNRGIKVKFHSQTNEGGNTDFHNMVDQTRLASKKISKENVIRSQNDLRGIPVPENGIYAGPSAYIPYLGDNKVAHFRIEGEGFGGAPIIFDARLSVQDSPNSAGVVIDAIRYLKVAREMGMVGALHGPSAATQKTPPAQMMIQDAYEECKALANREWTSTTLKYNVCKDA